MTVATNHLTQALNTFRRLSMGACDFSQQAKGKTMLEAFNDAVDAAQYEYGHGGYTGTIAEKGSFVEFKIPGVEGKTLIKWLDEYSDEYYANDHKHLTQNGSKRPDGLPVNEWETHRDKLHRMHDIFSDKWGPCVGIQLDKDFFHFAGRASS